VAVPTRARDVGVFAPGELDALTEFFIEHGYATLRGVYDHDELDALQHEMEVQQRRLLAGELPERCGTVVLDDPDAVIDGEPFAHYVCHITEVSSLARAAVVNEHVGAVVHRLIGDQAWLLDDDRFGVVYQDARPGERSGYSRIGWHTDFQSGPHLAIWPSIGTTIHLDATSPQNGFLRVVPGSHRGDAEGMPPGFEKVPGEIAVYCERGDVLFHHSDLWHSAARATDEGEDAVRRHLRGGWYGGERLAPNHGIADFVKNARR
jgi:ectoine hydroxylase-related dioxygenase (phytanoyl-CoA dioxygenase family)